MTATQTAALDLLNACEPGQTAVFLDFDGVLVALAELPNAIVVAPSLAGLMADLDAATQGAMSIVSGRELRDLRRYLPDAPASAIGSHGAERALSGAPVWTHPAIGSPTVAEVQTRVEGLLRLSGGILIERKPTGAVAHYRQVPEAEAELESACVQIAAAFPGYECHAAKCAFELRPDDVGKAKAVAWAMEHPAFLGRTPVYMGDDATDEPALAWVQDNGGLAVKVGEGDSVAHQRLAGPQDVHALLASWITARAEGRS